MGRLSLISIFLTFASNVVCEAPKIARAVNASADLFHHRGFQTSVVVGNTLYIDGGEITTWDGTGDGVQVSQPQPSPGNINTQPVNFTYSIDLSSAWTNSSVTINTIGPKAAPLLNNQALWLDAENHTIYTYNGGISQAVPNWWTFETPPANALWEFNPDSSAWSSAYISPSSIFSSLVRVTASINAYGNGLGFALGGFQNDATQTNLFSSIFDSNLVGGMIIYNITSQEWYNVSTTDYTSTGYTIQGAGLFVPPFGPDGLLFVFGGQYGPSDNLQYAQFEYVWMYEPDSKTWTSQKVTGDIPSVGNAACVVGAQGDNGTYEIFMFGGIYGGDIDKTVDLSAVYILSLPSFTWYKVADPTYGRFFHSCNVAGNRQMISVGGVVVDRSTSPDTFKVVGGIPDPWSNGFGVFDLVDLEWKSSFDPSPGAYVTPDVVKSNIQQNGFYPSDWQDSTVEKWFTHPGSASSGTSSGSTNENGGNGGSSTNTGAIAGGVVGGVAGLSLIGALVWFLLRRRKRRMGRNNPSYQYQPSADPKYHPSEADGNARPTQELDAEHGRQELPVRDKPAQPSPGQVHELDSGRWSNR